MISVILTVLGVGCLIVIILSVVLAIAVDWLQAVVDKRRKNGGGWLWNTLYYILGIIQVLRFWD